MYPIFCLVLFNIGMGLILSALYVFFRDMQYLWRVCTQIIMYMSAIFYRVDNYGPHVQRLFLINPVYVYIKYFRVIVIDAVVPSLAYHLLMAAYALVAVGIGSLIYKKFNHRFLYYV